MIKTINTLCLVIKINYTLYFKNHYKSKQPLRIKKKLGDPKFSIQIENRKFLLVTIRDLVENLYKNQKFILRNLIVIQHRRLQLIHHMVWDSSF